MLLGELSILCSDIWLLMGEKKPLFPAEVDLLRDDRAERDEEKWSLSSSWIPFCLDPCLMLASVYGLAGFCQ